MALQETTNKVDRELVTADVKVLGTGDVMVNQHSEVDWQMHLPIFASTTRRASQLSTTERLAQGGEVLGSTEDEVGEGARPSLRIGVDSVEVDEVEATLDEAEVGNVVEAEDGAMELDEEDTETGTR